MEVRALNMILFEFPVIFITLCACVECVVVALSGLVELRLVT